MKRTILAVLMLALVSSPCFAQEVEPEGIFSLEGTLWRFGTAITFYTRFPFFQITNSDSELGFHQETVYRCSGDNCDVVTRASYINSPVLSIVYFFNVIEFGLIIMQPIGLGISTSFGALFPITGFYYSISLIYKIDDNWSPPEDEPPTE